MSFNIFNQFLAIERYLFKGYLFKVYLFKVFNSDFKIAGSLFAGFLCTSNKECIELAVFIA